MLRTGNRRTQARIATYAIVGIKIRYQDVFFFFLFFLGYNSRYETTRCVGVTRGFYNVFRFCLFLPRPASLLKLRKTTNKKKRRKMTENARHATKNKGGLVLREKAGPAHPWRRHSFRRQGEGGVIQRKKESPARQKENAGPGQ